MLTGEELLAIMPRVPAKKRDEVVPLLQAAMTEFGVKKPARAAAFLAQLAHESGQLRFMEEIWGPTEAQRRYEPPGALSEMLGNTEPGDGKRFKGRGPIQITGRANYRRYGGLLGIDLVSDPDRATLFDLGFRIAGLFWERNGLNELADRADADAFRLITKRINGGLTGQKDREHFYAVACAVLGVVAPSRSGRAGVRRQIPDADWKPVLERGHEAIRAHFRSERRPKPREASMPARVATTVRKREKAESKTKSSKARRASGTTARGAAKVGKTTDESRYTVVIRYRIDGRVEDLQLTTDDRSFYPVAQRWRYVVANRRRITRATRDSLSSEIAVWMADVCELEPSSFETRVKWMARSEVVEVSVPFVRESVGWAARLFPWENALGLLTRPFREETAPFTVFRHLSAKKTRLADKRPGSLLIVRSGPGEIGSRYELDRECQMVADALRPALPSGSDTVLREPDRLALQSRIKTLAPAIVHLSGVDPYALETLGILKADPENPDGFVLRKADGVYDIVDPGDLAAIVTAASDKPLLVALTSCFSASRIAALSVANGARYSIGFLDTLTDADAILFFGCFYRAWMREWDMLAAFVKARAEWMAQASPQSTGVVLWSRHSLFEPEAEATTRADVSVATPSSDPAPALATVGDLKLHVALIPDRAPAGARSTSTSLNYSLLHNDRTPFKTFFVEKPLPGRLPPLQIEVELEVGNEFCRCRFSEELPETAASIELAPRMRLPLVAGLLRQCTESLRTNLYIKVSCGDRLLRESSERVTVLPADEWRDDGEDHKWLPSFVLPRDPAVLKVIDAAQRYLRTLLDDCSAGFDGYQQLVHDDSNAPDVVDPQVQAIWAALQHDLPINYINPPPSYTSQSQRLRSPTEVFRGHAATCIDLALLFASCLEFVGIYPVVFLISGHAFPGYWRSDKAWWRMKQFRFEETGRTAEPAIAPRREVIRSGQSEGWMFDGIDNLVELLRYVQDGTLVPFEGTFVAAQRGFFQSLEEGSGRLHPDTFDAMIDIQSARAASVTPLPLVEKP
jgi:predicted chitinase